MLIKRCKNEFKLPFWPQVWDMNRLEVKTCRLTFLHRPLEVVQHAVVVNPAEHLLFHQGELLPGGQLPLAGEAGEAG